MDLFFLVFLNFLASMLAILVSVSSAILFYVTQRLEQSMKTFFRAFGFASLAVAFFLFVLERKFPSFELVAVLIETIGFISIFLGVLKEPGLTKLRTVTKFNSRGVFKFKKTASEQQKTMQRYLMIASAALLVVVVIEAIVLGSSLIIERFSFGKYLPALFVLVTTFFISGTIFLQARRYFREREDKTTRLQNLYPLLAYIALLFRSIFLILYRLPESDIVFIQTFENLFSFPWRASVVLALVAFIFLGLWVWFFIRPRIWLRTIVSFFAVAIIVSSLGSLVFTLLIFSIVEQDNFKLMTEGAKTQQLVMDDRSNTALVLARSIAADTDLIAEIANDDYFTILDKTEDQLLTSGIDILRVYDSQGQVIASPSDERERNEVFTDDKLLQDVLQKKHPIRSFDIEEHVLSPLVTTRAIYPIIDKKRIAGAVEVGYKLDTAFVDFSKSRTGLDVTIYTDSERSATTVFKLDGVSRFVGTTESNDDVITTVLKNGENFALEHDLLGQNYYSAFLPIRNFEGEIIGMVSVGTPTFRLFEDSRQQLLTSFLILTLISMFAASTGYFAMRNFELEQNA
ncbi:MAG: cache domain-containing protein [Candidatus Dojkabacteria bacterium]